MPNLHDRLTLVIPTHNRPAFLRRLLFFLAQTDESCQIQIVDSSTPAARQQNESLVSGHTASLRISYRHLDAGMISKCRTVMEENVSTPFAVFCADDDFLMPPAVRNCLEFLERSPGYSCAQGAMVSLSTGKSNKCYLLPCYSLESDRPERRFKWLARHWYSTFYSVYRTPLLTRAWQIADDHSDDRRARIFPEILLSQLSATQGKVKYVPGVFNLREEHTQNESAVTPDVSDIEHADELYEQFRTVMARELGDASGMPVDRAGRVVDSCYGYLRDGGVAFAATKKQAGFRLRRNLIRNVNRIRDLFRHDAILQRRRLRLDSDLCHVEGWELAHRLIVEYPTGMQEVSRHAA